MARALLACIPASPGAGKGCVHNQTRNNPCRACMNACPTAAIRYTAQGVVIDEAECVGCGQCLFVCPGEALENIPAVSRRWQQDKLVSPLSSLPASVEELLIWHAEYHIRAIELADTDNASWLRVIAELNLILKKLNQPCWRIDPPTHSGAGNSKRRWLGLRSPSINQTAVSGSPRRRRASYPTISWFRLQFDAERCFLCGACARVCPEQAIRLHPDRLTLDHQRCTHCGNCTAACFAGAIRSERWQQPLAPQRFSLLRKQCTACQQTFNAWSSQQMHCPVCQRHAFGMREA